MLKAIIFDLDHTLFDRYATFEKIVVSQESSALFAPNVSKEAIKAEWEFADRKYVHTGWEYIYGHLKEKGLLNKGIVYEDFFPKYVRPLFSAYAANFDFTAGVLEQLHRGYKLGIITNGDHELQARKIELLGIARFFDEIVITGDYGFHKPHTEIFNIMAKKLNLNPKEMIYVGDHPLNDVEGSRKAGYTPVWVNTTGNWSFPEIEKPELCVDTIAELPEIIKKISL